MAILTKNRMVTAAFTIGLIALVYRYDPAKKLLTGESGGIFG